MYKTIEVLIPTINADISDDYDVEQLADKVKGIIYDEAMYKNVSTINRLR